jgi:ABC-type Mn2+/Zn2+ transport system permease subunit
MLHALADPWTQDFVRRAFLELALAGIAGGALGCWVVYELSYSAESLAALFPARGGALFGVPPW